MTEQPSVIPSSDGVRVVLHDLGGTGEPLLVAHATGFHARAYLPVARELAGTFHSLGADLRGHGDANAPTSGDFSWEGFADDVLAVIDHLDPGRPIAAFGHSKGGAALVLAEQRRPGTFSGLYLYEPILFPPFETPEAGNFLAESARRRREVFDSYEAAIANYASKPPLSVFTAEALEAYVRYGFEELDDGRVRLKCRGEHEALTFETSTTHDAFARLGELDLPVTIAASGDGSHPALVAPEVVERIPDAKLEVFEDMTHFGPFENPARLARAIEAALVQSG